MLVITDQQFDYWYDPCGKSGYDLNRYITRRSLVAVETLRKHCGLEPVTEFHKDPKWIKKSNSLPFLITAFNEACPTGGSMGAAATAALRRLKGLLWHGELVEETVLDDIVEALADGDREDR